MLARRDHKHSPRASRTAGTAPRRKKERQLSTGRATLMHSTPKMPRQMTSWLMVPRVPRSLVGATSEM